MIVGGKAVKDAIECGRIDPRDTKSIAKMKKSVVQVPSISVADAGHHFFHFISSFVDFCM